MDNFDLKKFLGKKSLLNENAPGYDTRKQGGALPTLESVKAAYEAKNSLEEEDFDMGEAMGDDIFSKKSNDYKVKEKIFDLIRDYDLDPSDMLEEIGQEFGINFEFGAGNWRMEESTTIPTNDRKKALKNVMDILIAAGFQMSTITGFIETHKDDFYSGDIDAYDAEDIKDNWEEYQSVNFESGSDFTDLK